MSTTTELDPSEETMDLTSTVHGKQVPLGSLTAAGIRLTSKKIKGLGRSAKAEAWQEDAWDMYDLVGEQRFLASTLANRMAQARFYVGKLPDDPTEDIQPITEGPAADAFNALVGKGNHFAQMVQRMGVNLFIPGDGYLVGIPKSAEPNTGQAKAPNPSQGITPLGTYNEEEGSPLQGIDVSTLDWQMLSVTELSFETNGDITIKGAQFGEETSKTWNADDIILIRTWRPHPRRWWQADSPTRSSLPVLRELVGLTMKISANIDSRLAGAGVLFVPASADQSIRAASGAMGDDVLSPLAEALMDAMLTPITDRSNASSVVPLMPVVPDESIEKFKWLTNPMLAADPEDRANREEAIRRLALGQDCPPELLLGVSGMNHWGAWLVREDVVTTHLEPPLALICDAITTQFLWLVLEDAGVEDYEQYVVWYDVDHLILRPNRSADAIAVHAAGELNGSALRDATGFDESAAPEVDPTDNVTKLILDMIREAPSLTQNPGLEVIASQVRALVAGQVIPPTPGIGNDPEADSAPDATDSTDDSSTEGGTPDTADDGPMMASSLQSLQQTIAPCRVKKPHSQHQHAFGMKLCLGVDE